MDTASRHSLHSACFAEFSTFLKAVEQWQLKQPSLCALGIQCAEEFEHIIQYWSPDEVGHYYLQKWNSALSSPSNNFTDAHEIRKEANTSQESRHLREFYERHYPDLKSGQLL